MNWPCGEQTFGPDHPNLAIRHNNLAAVHQELRDVAAARVALERAVHICEQAFGPDHAQTKAARHQMQQLPLASDPPA